SLANTDFDSNGLNTQLDRVRTSISALENASRETFTQAQIDVDKEITSLNNLITTLKNAEYAATSLRTKDINTVKIDEGNNLNTFVQKMEQSGHYTDELKQKVENLRTQLNGVFDANTLTSYLNSLSNLESEFKSVDATAKTLEKSTKLQTNIEAEKKILQVYTNELKEAGVLTDDVKEKIQNMFYSLSKVDSQNGLTTWRAELKGVKAETDAVLKSVTQLSQKRLDEIQLSMTDKSAPNDNYALQVQKLIEQLSKLGLTDEEVAQKTKVLTEAQAELQRVIDSNNFDSVNAKNQAILDADEKRTVALNQVKNAYEQAKLAYDKYMQPVSNEKATSLINRINSFLTKNTKITKDARVQLQGYADELGRGVHLSRWNEINGILKETENSMRGLGRLGASLKDQMSQAAQSFTQWLSVSSAVMLLVSKIKNAITELKEVNSIMTEISKTADQLSKTDLTNIEKSSYNTASKYGKKASNYLTGIQEMYRAGYSNAEDLAELSTLAQAAGDMEADLANDYLIATDAAYKLKGSTEALNAVLDGQNYITNRNALSMKDLAEATKIAASQSASSGIAVDKATAAMGTMIATTRQGGDIAARAWKGILMNLQQVEGEVEDGEILDAEALSKYEKACEDLGVSLKEVKDGVISLRDPMKILEELSKAYTALDESDARRANLISAVGGKYRGNQLNALLENWSLYEKMLKDYAEGSGSAMEEAMKSANNWEGSINRLGNTFTKIVRNIVNSNAVITVTNDFNDLLSVIDKITSKLGSLGTIGLGAGIFAGLKNVGGDKMYSLICHLF
ncbi:MAG: phage tail tape measure protein, partial [Ruminococcus flavefaciens]|nr:phage tail tape measure protein [Ruminococcus flavefaciens]